MNASDGNYELRWPAELLRDQLAYEMNNRRQSGWDERVQAILMDAFTTSVPLADFNALASGWPNPDNHGLSSQHRWVAQLMQRADKLPSLDRRRPYYSARVGAGGTAPRLDLRATIMAFGDLYIELDKLGYFEEAWGKLSCPDVGDGPLPEEVISGRLHHDHSWPFVLDRFVQTPEYFFDLVEVLFDIVSARLRVWWHSYGGCGAHGLEFDRARGRAVYAWRVNRLLDRSELQLTLATSGEDMGRLVSPVDPGLSDLIGEMAPAETDSTDGQVPHAIALFRERRGTPHDKRSAVAALANVLEERRDLLKAKLLSKDEGALFQIANGFAVRHQGSNQQSQFDPAFYDWMFYWYLATIQLTDRILAQQQATLNDAAELTE